MINISQHLLVNRKNRPALSNPSWYKIRKLKGIVIHWTANTGIGSDALRNRSYFESAPLFVSSHYIVDDHSVLQIIPENEVAYHCGGKTYTDIGKAIIEDNLTPNYFLLGIEMCVNRDGDFDKTYQNTIELVQRLLTKYNLTSQHLFRHHDITGKDCPKMLLTGESWKKFKDAVNIGLLYGSEKPIKQGIVKASEVTIYSDPGYQNEIVGRLVYNDPIEIYEIYGNWFRISHTEWISKNNIEVTFSKKQGTTTSITGTNIYSEPNPSSPIVDIISDGVILELFESANGYYKIGQNQWLDESSIQHTGNRTGKINVPTVLNIRSGPATSYSIVRTIKDQTLVEIFETYDHWHRIGDKEWVSASFVTLLDQEEDAFGSLFPSVQI